MTATTGQQGDVTVWWTGPCGALHCETNPPVVGGCPDGVGPDWQDENGSEGQA